METKQVLFGIAVMIASVGGSAVVGGPKTETAEVKIGATATEKTASTIANIGDSIRAVKTCTPQRAFSQTVAGEIELSWDCGGAVPGPEEQAELDKIGGEGASEIRFEPKEVGGKIELVPHVTTGGALPNLDPVPEAAVVEQPAEALPK